MAKNTPVTKQELKERQKRIDARNRNRALVERKDVAITMTTIRNNKVTDTTTGRAVRKALTEDSLPIFKMLNSAESLSVF